MKKVFLQHGFTGILSMVLVTPTLYFLGAAFMYYGLGIYGPWSLIEPIFEAPDNKSIGFNINLLILFGPVVSFFISLFQVVRIEIKKHTDEYRLIAFITKKSFHWFIIIAALLCMGSLFLYSIAENCNCH